MSVEPTPGIAPMDCEDAERALDPWIDGELSADDSVELRAHLDACEPCRLLSNARAEERRALRRCLRNAHAFAPPALRLRIVQALEAERRPWWRRAVAPLPIAAVGACCAGLALVLVLRAGADPLADEAVMRHARDLPLEITTASVGPESIPAWFTGKLDFNPRPPRFAEPDVRLVGARLSHIHDRPAAYIRYELPRGRLGLFILEDRERRFGERGRAVRVGPHEVHVLNAHGYNIAVWRRGEIVYSLVTDLDEEQIARLLRTAAQGAAAGAE
jgi:anti-sigma factor (TIGR02949 family)